MLESHATRSRIACGKYTSSSSIIQKYAVSGNFSRTRRIPRLRFPPMCVFFPRLTYSIARRGFASANLPTSMSTRLPNEPSSTIVHTRRSSGQLCARIVWNANFIQWGRFHVSVITPTRGSRPSAPTIGGEGAAPKPGTAGIFSKSRSIVFQRSWQCCLKIPIRSFSAPISRLRVAKISSCGISSRSCSAMLNDFALRGRGAAKNSHTSPSEVTICPLEPITSSKNTRYAGTSDQSGRHPVRIASHNAYPNPSA